MGGQPALESSASDHHWVEQVVRGERRLSLEDLRNLKAKELSAERNRLLKYRRANVARLWWDLTQKTEEKWSQETIADETGYPRTTVSDHLGEWRTIVARGDRLVRDATALSLEDLMNLRGKERSGERNRVLRYRRADVILLLWGLKNQLSYPDIAKETGYPLGTVKDFLKEWRKIVAGV